MAKLKATRCILYLNRLYQAGESLPCDNTRLVAAWLETGAAVWYEETVASETKTGEIDASQPGSTPPKAIGTDNKRTRRKKP